MADGHPEAPAVYPNLAYRDAPAAMDWLTRSFGFTKVASYAGPDGSVRHAEMRLGKAIVMIATAMPQEGWKPPADLGGVNQYVSVYLEDIDAHYERAKKAGARIARELAPTDYGTRAYAAVDPEGHYWWFDTYHPHW